MKQRISNLFHRFLSVLKNGLPRVGIAVKNMLTRRLLLKLISLLIAIVLWTYIVSNTSTLTNTKVIRNLSVTSPAVNSLSSSLAVATDFTDAYRSAVTVEVSVPQNYYADFSEKNVKVTLDYSSIRTAGVYNLPLIATTTHGEVKRITPSTVSVVIEELDSCEFPLEIDLNHVNDGDYWYDMDNAVMMLEQINVSGPASLVQSVEHAVVDVDVGGSVSAVDRSFKIVLLDEQNHPITSRLLKKTNSTNASVVSRCRVKLGIYPRKTLTVTADPSQLRVEEGYEIESITFKPAAITVAGMQNILDEYDTLGFIPDETRILSPENNTMEGSLFGLDNFRYKSASNIQMTVTLRRISGENADE